MKIHTCSQSSPEWLALRSNYPTASEFSNLVSPVKLKVCEGKAIASYVALKLSEKWLGHPVQTFTAFGAVDQGKVREDEAKPWYALEFDCEVDTVGFVTNDEGTAGCSPDGLITAARRALELKCPEPPTHVKWLVAGGLPPEHLLQCHGTLLVTGWDELDFVSYHPRFPKFVYHLKRDRAVCNALEDGLGAYWDLFKAGWATLLDANGGEEPTRDYSVSYEGGDEVKTLNPEYGDVL